jgi:sterol carrier protein 2
MSAPVADGGACAILCSEDFVIRNGLQRQAVEIMSQHLVTDMPSSFEKSYIDLSGYQMAKQAATSNWCRHPKCDWVTQHKFIFNITMR